MTEETSLPPLQESGSNHGVRTLTHVLYGLYAVHWLTGGLTSLIALVINYVKRDDAAGTPYEAHFTWQIRTFWMSLIAYAVGIVLALVGVGFLILGATWVWTLYRIVKGWLYLYDGKPLDARAWF
jgi:uncharacterized membrane protein